MNRIHRTFGDVSKNNFNFVELRAERRTGRILGCTACCSSASELVNSMGIAITNRLTTTDIARSIHSYPSDGYLLHRIAMSMAFSSIWGLLEASGLVGNWLAIVGRRITNIFYNIKRALFHLLPTQRKKLRLEQKWFATGSYTPLIIRDNDNTSSHGKNETEECPTSRSAFNQIRIISYLEHYLNIEKAGASPLLYSPVFRETNIKFQQWLDKRPLLSVK